jgi:hypothetical protein
LPKSEGFILERDGNALFYLCQAMHFLAAVLCIFIMPKTIIARISRCAYGEIVNRHRQMINFIAGVAGSYRCKQTGVATPEVDIYYEANVHAGQTKKGHYSKLSGICPFFLTTFTFHAVKNYNRTTFAACGPLLPCTTSNSTRCPSSRLLNPEPWIAEK